MRIWKHLTIFGFALVAASGPVTSDQTANAQSAQAATAKATAAAPANNWVTQCNSTARSGPMNCSMEQRVILRETGRQIARLTIRKGQVKSQKAGILVHLPHGLSIRGGVKMQIDKQQPITLDIQTCDAAGCYSGSPMTDGLLVSMKKGSKLNIAFRNLQQGEVTIPITLAGFSKAYKNIQ